LQCVVPFLEQRGYVLIHGYFYGKRL
jgi:hypothetical protein